MDLFQCFDRAAIINLPGRKDRRREMERQIKLAGISANQIEFFPAIRPSALDDWPTLGARGCLLSHYTLLRQARERGLRSIALLEDDCNFEPCFARVQAKLAEQLTRRDWGLVFFGHWEPCPAGLEVELRACTVACTTHFYAVGGQTLGRLVDYLEALLSRPAGHPLGGPQHYDGALFMFREQNPELPILLAFPNLGRQRRSRSDINPQWFDKTPVVRNVVNEIRRYRQLHEGR